MEYYLKCIQRYKPDLKAYTIGNEYKILDTKPFWLEVFEMKIKCDRGKTKWIRSDSKRFKLIINKCVKYDKIETLKKKLDEILSGLTKEDILELLISYRNE